MTGSKAYFAGVFSRHAQAYRRRHEEIRLTGGSSARRRLLQSLEVRPGDRVLDLCCGPGNLGSEVLEREPGALLAGVDLAPGMLALVRFPALRGDAEALPLRDGSFDAVACGHGLQFCPDLGAVFREVRRVLRPEGRFAASLPRLGGPPDPVHEVLDRLLPPGRTTPDRAATLATLADPARLSALAAGFLRDPEVDEVFDEVRAPSAEAMFRRSFEWWFYAARLEGLSPVQRDGLLQQVIAEFVAANGDGPISIPGSDLVLYASA